MRNILFEQAERDVLSTRLYTESSKSYIRKGIKIEVRDDVVRIYNTKFGGDFYREISKEEYDLFLSAGWKVGCYTLAIKNYRTSLERLSKKIITEINSRKNHRHYNALRETRSDIMERFTDTLKLLQNEAKRQL